MVGDDRILNYSLADFFANNSPSVLSPPQDFLKWYHNPMVQQLGYAFYEQELMSPPSVRGRLKAGFDGKIRHIINLTSYNYLGLSTHPEVIEAAHQALDTYGLGSSGAPQLSGTFDLHHRLVRAIADFKQKEDAMVFSSGYGGNLGALQALLRPGDAVIMDEKIHRSLVDGANLAGVKPTFFQHNDMDDLERKLSRCDTSRILVVVEGVYSMDGDLAKLPGVVQLCQQYKAGLFLDEAHSSLMFGANGRGVAEHFGLEDEVGVSFGTMSKSFGGIGGFICASRDLIGYMKGYASAWNFSCAIAPAIAGGLLKALEVATRDSQLRDRLWSNTALVREGLRTLGLDTGASESQVIPIIIGSSGSQLMNMAHQMQLRGLFLQPVDYPAVPAHSRRFRISVSSQLTREDIDQALNIIEDVIAKTLRGGQG